MASITPTLQRRKQGLPAAVPFLKSPARTDPAPQAAGSASQRMCFRGSGGMGAMDGGHGVGPPQAGGNEQPGTGTWTPGVCLI